MSELIDDSHRRRARKRLLSELLLESEWLMQRRPSSTAGEALFPTASAFFGCAPAWKASHTCAEGDGKSERQLYALAGPACVLSAAGPAAAAEEASAERRRVRHHWASLCRAQALFGDDVDRGAEYNPQHAVEVVEPAASESLVLQWVHNPFTGLNPTSAILAGTRLSPTAQTTLRVLGDPAPLSPVVQPYPFFSRRNRRRACPMHSHLETRVAPEAPPPETRAYRAAWDREEPLTLPPTCSCTVETLTNRYLQIVKRLVDSLSARLNSAVPPSPASPVSPPSDEPAAALREAAALLDQQTDCAVCGGLQYFPFSFIETPLTRETSSLLDFCEHVPLPPRTEVFCDGPKVTVCVICKSPQHEWDVYKALYTANVHTRAVIYDVCTSHYFPGYKPSKLYWARTLAVKSSPQVLSASALASLSPSLPAEGLNSPSATSVNSPQSANLASAPEDDGAGGEPETAVQRAWRCLLPPFEQSPLRPPPQCPLNLSRCEPHPLYSPLGAPSLTTPELRRVYCITPRFLPRGFDPALHISSAECTAIEAAHRSRIQYEEATRLTESIASLRRRNVLAEHKLTLLRQQAWGFRLCTPELPTPPKQAPRVQQVVPLRLSAQPRRDTPAVSDRPASRDARRSPSGGRASNRDRSAAGSAQSSKSRGSTGGGDTCRRPGDGAALPRYPHAYSSAAASRIHALRAGANSSQPHSDRRLG